MLFPPDGKYLLVGDSRYFPSETAQLVINSSGFPKQTPLEAPGGGPIEIIDDTLYTINGISLNWRTMRNQPTGRYRTLLQSIPSTKILSVFAPPQYSPYKSILQAFDLATQSGLGTQPLPVSPLNLYRFGADGRPIPQLTDSILTFNTPLAGPAPSVPSDGIVNAASFLGGSIAPGEILSIFGSSLGPAEGQSFTVTGNLVNSPAGMQIWFDRRPVPRIFAYTGQMNALAPLNSPLDPAYRFKSGTMAFLRRKSQCMWFQRRRHS